MRPAQKRSLSAISSVLDLLGDKWSLLIVRDLAWEGKSTYGELLGSDERFATNILANRLGLLEMAGLIERRPHVDRRTKSSFHLTPKGLDLLPLLEEMVLWADAHLTIAAADHQRAAAIRAARASR